MIVIGLRLGASNLREPHATQPGRPHLLSMTYWGLRWDFLWEKLASFTRWSQSPHLWAHSWAYGDTSWGLHIPCSPSGPSQPTMGPGQPAPTWRETHCPPGMACLRRLPPERAAHPAETFLMLSQELHAPGRTPGSSCRPTLIPTVSCRYKDYREPPWSEHKYDISKDFWAVLAARLAFVIVFQVRRWVPVPGVCELGP